MMLHKTTEFHAEWFSDCPNINSKFETTPLIQKPVKENDSNNTCKYAHDLLRYKASFVLAATTHELSS
jgi:hypothetical protein